MQFPLLAGLTAALAYTFMQIAIKRQGTPLGPLSLTALLGLLLPFWLLFLLTGLNTHLLTLTPTLPYFALTFGWAVLATASMALLAYLIARLPLTPLTAWRKMFTLLLALAVDIILLHQTFPMGKIIGIGLLGLGSFMLTPQTPPTRKAKANTLSMRHTVAAAAILACIMTLQLALYQQALHLQTDVLSHVALAKALMALCSLALLAHPATLKATRKALTHNTGNKRIMAVVATFFVIGSLAEGAALQQGTLTLLVVATLVVPALFTAHDLYNRDLPTTRNTLLALALVFIGFALTAFAS